MLGDTAVAVQTDDRRYKDLIGKILNLPLTKRRIPIISDNAVDPSFGTGAVKVTPAHDFNDEAIAKRHTPPLEFITVIGKDGNMTDEAGSRYKGMDRYECRRMVLNDLKEQRLLEKEEKYKHSLGHCYRCKTVIEPLLTLQWYVNVKPLANEAIKVVREGGIRIVPGHGKTLILPGWKISGIGVYPARYGGGTGYRHGTARKRRVNSAE